MLVKGSAPVELLKINHVLSYEMGDMTGEMISTLENELWKDVGFENFAGLVYSPMPNGFQSTRDVLRHWFREQDNVLIEINKALPDKDIKPFEIELKTEKELKSQGGDRKSVAVKGSDQDSNTTLNKDRGAEYTARRLKRDNPELLDKVKEGDLSLNQAAVQAGFRKKNISIPFDPQEAARALKRRYAKTEWDLLINEIQILTNQEKP